MIINKRMSTYRCSQQGTAHKEYPRLSPKNSSRKLWKHPLQFHCYRQYLHCLLEVEHPNSNFQSGYLFTIHTQKKCQADSFYMEAENLNPFQKLFQKLFKNTEFIFTEKLNWDFIYRKGIWKYFTNLGNVYIFILLLFFKKIENVMFNAAL